MFKYKIPKFIAVLFLAGGLLLSWYSFPNLMSFYKKWRSCSYYNRAIVAIQKAQIKEAQIYLRNALRHNPENASILKKLLEITPKEELKDRLHILFEIYARDSNGDTAANIIEEFINNNLLEEAASFAERSLTLHSENPSIWLASGKAFLLQGRYAAAKDAFTGAVKLNPTCKKTDFYLALLEFLTNPHGNTRNYSLLESFLAVEELRQEVTQKLLAIYLKEDPERAKSILEKLVSENPQNWNLRYLQFKLNLDSSSNVDTLCLWEDFWNVSSTLEHRLMIISEAIQRKLFSIANTLMLRLNNKERKTPNYIWLELLFHVGTEDWQNAQRIANDSLTDESLSEEWKVRFLAVLSLAQRKLENHHDSDLTYVRSKRIAKDNLYLSYSLVDLYLHFDLNDYAQDLLDQIGENTSPYYELAWQRLLKIYLQKKNWEHALKTLEKLLICNPSNDKYKTILCSMLLIDKKIEHPLIQNILNTNFEKLPIKDELIYLVSHALAQSGNIEKAEKLFTKAENANQGISKLSIHRIATLAYLGRKKEAQSAYLQLIKDSTTFHDKEKEYLEKIIME